MPDYTVGNSDSIPSIAKDKGFFWKTIWNHPNNAQLKALRKDPNQLFTGDKVFIPELEQKEESRATEALHEFRRKGDPVKFKIQLRKMGKPRKNEDYVLKVASKLIEGATDAEGKIETFIPGNAKSAVLTLKGGHEEHHLSISRLDPIEELTGVQQRLNNLGFHCGSIDGKLKSKTKRAISEFQAKHLLPMTGEADAATMAALKQLHE